MLFYGLASLLAFVVLAWLLRAMLRAPKGSAPSSSALNVSIYREQLQAVERDLASGAISAAEADSARDELQLRMLDDAQEDDAAPARAPAGAAKWTALAITVLLLGGSAGMYAWLGAPGAIDPVTAQNAERDRVYAMVEQLAQKLKDQPDNLRGWAMLGRSYKVMGRMDDAMQAYAKVGSLLDTDPDVMVDYADLLAVRTGNTLDGRPIALVRKALEINPKHPMALMLAAAHAYQQEHYKEAIAYWESLLAVIGPDAQEAQQFMGFIAEAREKAGLSADKKAGIAPMPGGAPDGAMIQQMVERLAARLKDNPGDLEGWSRLARSYKVLGRLADAEVAYSKAGALVDKTPDMLTDFADVLAQRAGGSLEGRPLKLIDRALSLEPRHPSALMLSGTAAYQRGDFKLAIAQWEKLQAVFEPGSPDAQWVASRIAEAKAKLK